MPFELWARSGSGSHELDGGSDCPTRRGNSGERVAIVKYRDFLLWAVQKRLNRLICRLSCGVGWAEGNTSSIVFARWSQCVLSCGHIGATWRIRLNRPSARRCGLMSNYFDRLLLLHAGLMPFSRCNFLGQFSPRFYFPVIPLENVWGMVMNDACFSDGQMSLLWPDSVIDGNADMIFRPMNCLYDTNKNINVDNNASTQIRYNLCLDRCVQRHTFERLVAGLTCFPL